MKAMVRFLKRLCEEITSQEELDRFLVTEHLISLLYIPSSILISLSSLGKHGILPYATNYHWQLLMPASIYLTLTNARDLQICSRNFLLPEEGESLAHKTLLGQMQLAASLFVTLGSISLLNACIISVIHIGNNNSDIAGYKQYVASFGLFVTGSAANTTPLGREFMEYDGSRALLSFQHILASAFFCLEGFLLLPGLVEKESFHFRDSVASILATIASILLVFSSVVNYFHTLGLLQVYRTIVERKRNCEDLIRKTKRKSEVQVGLFSRLFGFFGSSTGGVQYQESTDNIESDDPYEAEAFLVTDSSSVDCSWDDIVDESVNVDVEEGRHRCHTGERRHTDDRRKKK